MAAPTTIELASEGKLRFIYHTFANESVDAQSDMVVTQWLNDMYALGYEVNTYQQANRWQFFLMEKRDSAS